MVDGLPRSDEPSHNRPSGRRGPAGGVHHAIADDARAATVHQVVGGHTEDLLGGRVDALDMAVMSEHDQAGRERINDGAEVVLR